MRIIPPDVAYQPPWIHVDHTLLQSEDDGRWVGGRTDINVSLVFVMWSSLFLATSLTPASILSVSKH